MQKKQVAAAARRRMDAGCRPAVFGLLGVKPLLAGRVDVDDRDAGRSTGRHADAISLRRSQKQPADLIYLAGRGTESMCAGGRFVRIDRENRDSRLRQLNGFFQCIHGFPPEPLLMDRSLMIASGTGCDCRQPVPAEADRTFWRDDTAVHVQTLKVGEAEAHDDVAPQADRCRVAARAAADRGQEDGRERAGARRTEMSTPGIDAPPWNEALIRYAKGAPMALIANVLVVLDIDPAFQGKIGWDLLRDEPMMLAPMPWSINDRTCPRPFEDADDTWLAEWMQRVVGLFVNSGMCHEAINTIAGRNRYHPVVDYLKRCVWDGKKRLDTVPERILHVKLPKVPNKRVKYLTKEEKAQKAYIKYVRSVFAKWMISAVARVCVPGCKADHVLVLEGEQGEKKSTFFSIIGNPWYTPDVAALGSKDAAEQIVGVWIVELDELDSLSRARDVAAAKSFISRPTDRFRWSYGRRVGEYRRQCVFGGTVNPQPWMRDPTGGRRFWPLTCVGEADTSRLIAERDQLWAEAFHRYEKGEAWYIEDKGVLAAAENQQMQRAPEDPWQSAVQPFLNSIGDNKLTTSYLMGKLKIPAERQGKAESMRMAIVLKNLGYIPKKVWDNDAGHGVRVYEKEQKDTKK